MKKLLILLLAFSLFTACNNEKGARNDRETRTTRDKDDYRDDDDRKKTSDDEDDDKRKTSDDDEDRDTRDDDDRKIKDDDDDNSSRGWSSSDVNDFVGSCVSSAVGGGMERKQATDYCECMQVKLEKLYPNPNDAANIDVNSSSMQKMVKDCL